MNRKKITAVIILAMVSAVLLWYSCNCTTIFSRPSQQINAKNSESQRIAQNTVAEPKPEIVDVPPTDNDTPQQEEISTQETLVTKFANVWAVGWQLVQFVKVLQNPSTICREVVNRKISLQR